MYLHLVRHGQTEENVRRILQGQSPGRLTPSGKSEADALADRLAALRTDPAAHFTPRAIICSDLARTRDTAERINSRLSLPLMFSPLLRERDWGELTGRQIDSLDRSRPFPPSVESVEALHRRAQAALAALWDEGRRTGGDLLVVSHGLFLRCLIATLQGVTIADIPPLTNAEMRTVTLTAPTTTVREKIDVEADN